MAIPLRPPVCAECSGPLPPAQATGRPRVFCSDRCKRRARRRRQQITPWPPTGPELLDKATIDRRTADALVRALEGDTPAPPEDQLAQAVLEAGILAWRFEALERALPVRLAGPAGELGRRLRRDLIDLFPTLGHDQERGA